MKLQLASLIGLMFLATSLGAAAVPESRSVEDWTEPPLSFLLTDEERESLRAGMSAEELSAFAELFWARRDPNGAAPGNSFRSEFAAKVEAADEQFGADDVRGASTDRGRALILLGVPSEHKVQPLQELMYQLSGRAQSDMSTSGWASRAFERDAEYDSKKAVADVWVYTREQIPSGVNVPKSQKYVMFVFVDRDGEGVYELERRYQPSELPMRVLDRAPAALVVAPELTRAPVPQLLADVPAAAPEEVAWCDVEPAPWPAGAVARVVPGLATRDVFPSWLYVRMPASVNADTLVGRLRDAESGAVLGTFRRSVEGTETRLGRVYEQRIPRFDGETTLDLVLAAAGEPVAVRRLPVAAEPQTEEEPYISPVYVGAEVVRRESFEAGAPFVFGGYHLLLRPEGRFASDEALAYFCLVARPDARDGDAAQARIRLSIYGRGGRLTGQPYRSVDLQEVAPDVFVFGSRLPLGPLAGYDGLRLKFWVEDPRSGVVRETEVPLEIEGGAR